MLLTLFPSGSTKAIDKLSNDVFKSVILSLLKALLGIVKLSKEAFYELIDDVFVTPDKSIPLSVIIKDVAELNQVCPLSLCAKAKSNTLKLFMLLNAASTFIPPNFTEFVIITSFGVIVDELILFDTFKFLICPFP